MGEINRENMELLNACAPFHDYSFLIYRICFHQNNGIEIGEAVDQAVDELSDDSVTGRSFITDRFFGRKRCHSYVYCKGTEIQSFFALLMAVVCIGAGIYLIFFHSAGFIPTKAQIVSITEDPDTFGEDSPSYIVLVSYKADGSEYTSRLDSYSPSYKEGKTIDVFTIPRILPLFMAGTAWEFTHLW